MPFASLADVNVVAVVVTTIVSFLLGGLWYAEPLFGRHYLAGIGRRADELGSPAVPMVLNFVAALVTSLVFAILIASLGLTTVAHGLTLGLLIGVGIIAAGMASDFAFNRFSLSFFLVEAGYRVVLSIIMGVVLTLWR